MENLRVRKFVDDDVSATGQIFFDSVRLGAAEYYDERQRNAWTEKVPNDDEWRKRLQSQHSFVAQLNTRLVGFMTLDDHGHIDLAFVVPDLIGKGVARALYERIEAEALRRGIGRLDTEASYMAVTPPIRIIYIMEYSDAAESRYLCDSFSAGAD